MATCTLTLGDDTHKFPLQPGGASTSTILEQARTGFAIPHAKVSISAGVKTASRAREKGSIENGAVVYLDGDMLYTLKTCDETVRMITGAWGPYGSLVPEAEAGGRGATGNRVRADR